MPLRNKHKLRITEAKINRLAYIMQGKIFISLNK